MKTFDYDSFVGRRFGSRVVLSERKKGYGGNIFFLCVCDCGEQAWVKLAHLTAGTGGKCKVCHCKSIATRHGQALSSLPESTPAYRAWVSMRSRVRNDKSYVRRGIECCARWSSFETFLRDMGVPPTPTHQLDRIDGTQGYSPENCRWATPSENNKNRQNLRLLTHNGKTQCIADWERELGLRVDTVRKRLAAGYEVPIALRVSKLPSGRWSLKNRGKSH